MNENKQQNPEEKQTSYAINKNLHPDFLKWIIFGLLIFIVLALIFSIGVWVGGAKARFSYRWAESYHQNFGGPREGFFGDWRKLPPPGDFIEAHGVFGQIIKIDGLTLIIKGRDNVERIVSTNDSATINRSGATVKIGDLKVNDYIVVIGEPNDAGQIEAKFIRLLPAPHENMPVR